VEKVKLVELFKMQNVLRDHIGYEGEDKKDKMLLALLVEIGECANEWRGFKYWSKKNKPVTDNWRVGNDLNVERYNPLKEEYVDGLHFVLDYGLEIGVDPNRVSVIKYSVNGSVTKQFLNIQESIFRLRNSVPKSKIMYEFVLGNYLCLGEMLGFSDDDIFNAYVEKNKVNHQRQDNGY
jgi:dimeric dUTPase (all-alpha-NTP-PPase superfamily)